MRLAFLDLTTVDIIRMLDDPSITSSRVSECFRDRALMTDNLLRINRRVDELSAKLIAEKKREILQKISPDAPYQIILPCDGVATVYDNGRLIGQYYVESERFVPVEH